MTRFSRTLQLAAFGAVFGALIGLALERHFGSMRGAIFGACAGASIVGMLMAAVDGCLMPLAILASSATSGALFGALTHFFLRWLLGDTTHVVDILISGGCGAFGALLGSVPSILLGDYFQSLSGSPRGKFGKGSIGSEIPPENTWPSLSTAGMYRSLKRIPTHTISRIEQERSLTQAYELVQCTVFAPCEVLPLDFFFLQAFLHKESQAATAQTNALEFDEKAVRRGIRSLGCDIPIGSRVMFELSLPGILLEKPVEELIWQGQAESVQFAAQVPEGALPQVIVGTLLISRDTIPLGHIKFKLTISPSRVPKPAQPIGEDARHYTSAFISYASEDRAKVLPRVQMLKATGINCFQDVLSLDPGARWERELYHHIETCDLFLLFWSNAAKKSEWVKKETMYALHRKTEDDFSPPEIRPVLIEGPPIPEPWGELQHLHFNDAIMYLVALEDHTRSISP